METVRGGRIVVALSGGADSVALTHALAQMSRGGRRWSAYELTAAHLNHRLRGEESDRDERFVRGMCERLQIDLVVEQVERSEVLAGSSNLEERARIVRYAFLNRVADRVAARHIAVAHHADDQAETVMLRLLRGTGVAGLSAMGACGPGRIVRPLLTVGRAEILRYLDAIGATYVIDGSNQSAAMLRNRVRHELMPMLERDYAPRLGRRLAGLAREFSEVDDHISSAARRELDRRLAGPDRLDLAGFDDLPPALSSSMIREWLREHRGDLRRVYRAEIERISRFCCGEAAAPGSLRLARGWRLRVEYGVAVLEPASSADTESAPFALVLARDGVTDAQAAGFTFVAKLMLNGTGLEDDAPSAGAAPMEALFDARRIAGELIVRSVRPGDRVRPLGMNGTRKVQDVYVDRKLARERRATWPIVEAGNEVLWIPGMLRSRFALLTEATDELLHLTAKPRARMGNECVA